MKSPFCEHYHFSCENKECWAAVEFGEKFPCLYGGNKDLCAKSIVREVNGWHKNMERQAAGYED